jgi:2-amino-4-hydroxy-6-hydroxymethyldihydropteridine diphosphokinase
MVILTRSLIALGSNIPDRLSWLQTGIDLLRESSDISVIHISHVYECPPVGEGLSGDFLNAVAAVDTPLSPHDLLDLCLEIEKKCHRNRTYSRNRTLDLDVIFHGDSIVLEPDLIVPHPRWSERAFVVVPLLDVIDFLTEWQRGIVEEAKSRLESRRTREDGFESCRLTDLVLY